LPPDTPSKVRYTRPIYNVKKPPPHGQEHFSPLIILRLYFSMYIGPMSSKKLKKIRRAVFLSKMLQCPRVLGQKSAFLLRKRGGLRCEHLCGREEGNAHSPPDIHYSKEPIRRQEANAMPCHCKAYRPAFQGKSGKNVAIKPRKAVEYQEAIPADTRPVCAGHLQRPTYSPGGRRPRRRGPGRRCSRHSTGYLLSQV
jgi:hypothetical protein